MRYGGLRNMTAGRRRSRKLPRIGVLAPGGCQFFQMDAPGNQHGIDPGSIGPRDIGAEAVTDGGDPLTVMDAKQVEAAPVNRSMRLAMIPDGPTQLLVALRQHTGA